jgi:hypothetical protein
MWVSPSQWMSRIDEAVAHDLVEHVIEEGHAGIELALAGAVEIDAHRDLRFEGVASDFCLPHGRLLAKG